MFIAGWSSLVARWAHNPKVAGSNPVPATKTFWGCSSAGRAPDLHSGGRRFDSCHLHQFYLVTLDPPSDTVLKNKAFFH
jgi:hypothetical protein